MKNSHASIDSNAKPIDIHTFYNVDADHPHMVEINLKKEDIEIRRD